MIISTIWVLITLVTEFYISVSRDLYFSQYLDAEDMQLYAACLLLRGLT